LILELEYAHDLRDSPVARASSPVPSALHPDGGLVDYLVERWFAALTEKQVRRGVHRSTRELELAIRRYIEVTNAHPKPLD
jgi:hypothetical protein